MIPAALFPLTAPVFFEYNPSEDATVAHAAAICAGTWATVYGGAGNTYSFSRISASYTVGITCCGTTNQYQSIQRAIEVFDLSGESGTRSGAILRLYVTALVQTLGSQSLVVTDASPASTSTIVYTDYANVGSTAYSSTVALSAMATSAYLDLTLNAAAITAINSAIGAGALSLGLRLEADRANSEPTWSASQSAKVGYSSRNTGTASQRPLLITW